PACLDNLPMTATPLTIADAQRILATWTDLPPARMAKMRTALATAASILAPPGPSKSAAAAAVPMDCASLNRLRAEPPATVGMSEGRRTSLCSELRYILRRLGRHEPDHRGQQLVTPAARACLDALPTERQYAVIDFLRFLEAE